MRFTEFPFFGFSWIFVAALSESRYYPAPGAATRLAVTQTAVTADSSAGNDGKPRTCGSAAVPKITSLVWLATGVTWRLTVFLADYHGLALAGFDAKLRYSLRQRPDVRTLTGPKRAIQSALTVEQTRPRAFHGRTANDVEHV